MQKTFPQATSPVVRDICVHDNTSLKYCKGELRIKVPREECANQIASVTLRLQLDEFGEVKFWKSGAVLPEILPSNHTAPVGPADWMGSNVVYDYQAYDDGLSDPELWTVKAEERRAWMTEATLLDNNPGS